MVDFFSTIEGKTLAAHIKTIARRLDSKEDKVETLSRQIYAEIVTREFYSDDGLSYDLIKNVADEAAKAYYKDAN